MLVSTSLEDWPIISQLFASLQNEPTYFAACIGVIAFLESFAILGLLVPGVALLFAVSALASEMQVDPLPLLLYGAIGSFIGDVLSFSLGKQLKANVLQLKILQNHQKSVLKAQVFCQTYGVYSLLIGRFIGPLRPIVPLTTGILDYNWLQFIFIAFIGACLWSPVYILPGFYSLDVFHLVFQWIEHQF